ncbi:MULTISPECIES: dicarboxylate/amino acid:cation symporter [Clostridium]|uniref:dicarboxylate/amino acid:cation symporter n=1 Tax=Clostridium TaxID=1485 RepID=UPI000E03ECBA|nr:dicarboxylate/amino acid:cation symporter [Clostridium sporogenes]MCW6084665.1 dicarboxylate/amino acid:cation symporter [Clostridium sporogenes]STC85084.1 sodium:dicarboxylate symporter family protein [Clostridium botulinum]
MKKLGLIPKIIIAIILGILIGSFTPVPVVRIFRTFSSIFGEFLGFLIPLIILGFIVAGIAELGQGAGKLLGITVGLAYLFTLISGFSALLVGRTLLPSIITNTTHVEKAKKALDPFFEVKIPPMMEVMTALIFAFILGLGIAKTQNKTLKDLAIGFQQIITKVIENVVIPLLPLHILGIFANLAYTGEVSTVLKVFWKVFIIILILHWIILIIQFSIGGSIAGKNPFKSLKIQIKGYLTALGTQSSAATIPINLQCSEQIGITKGIRDFVIPLCATVHLSGSTITLTICALAVMMLNGMPISISQMAGFIAMLGVTMVAAPGVPGGAVMAALGILKSILGFNEALLGLMIALYIAQDSFGTACNVSGDQAVAMIVDAIQKKSNKKHKNNNN